jgi:diguanylate cyclase (GGDEF)-like protein
VDLAKMAALAVVYYLAARLSLRLALVREQVTPIWPPTGIAVAGMLLFGRRMWPGIAISAFLVNLPIGPTALAAAVIAAGNTAAPLVSVSLLHATGFRTELHRLRDAMAIVFVGALLGMAVSATVGTTTLLFSDAIPQMAFLATWLVWWTGDAMGVLVFAPLLLTLVRWRPRGEAVPWTRRVEVISLVVLLSATTYLVFGSPLPIQYLVFPILAWAAWRFGQRGATLAVLVATGGAIWAAINATGPFAGASLVDKMVTLQVFNASAALSSFFLAAVVAERRENLNARDRAEKELIRRALHDHLTGLANRTLFIDRLKQALARSARSPGTIAVAFLDLDRFKLINDTLGHEAGDRVLRQMTERLLGVVREVDTPARFGGDEFVILFEDLRNMDEATAIGERLLQAIAEPMVLDTGEVVVTTSIGIAVAQDPDESPEGLVRAADIALYQAKEEGRARYVVFDRTMRMGTTATTRAADS